MMGLARDIWIRQARIRREQRKRNEEADRAERERQEAVGAKMRRLGHEDKMLRPAYEDKSGVSLPQPADSLGGVPFSTDVTRERAREAGLSVDDFAGETMTGAGGTAFNSTDLRRILRRRGSA